MAGSGLQHGGLCRFATGVATNGTALRAEGGIVQAVA
jgi:hypothetical protein